MNKTAKTWIGVGILMCILSPLAVSAVSISEQDAQAQEQIQKAANAYEEQLILYKTAKSNFKEAKQKYSGEDDSALASLLLEEYKIFSAKTVNAMAAYLELVKTQIQKNSNIDEATANEMVAFIDESSNWLKTKNEEIAAAPDLDTITQLGQEIQAYWTATRLDLEQKVLQLKIGRLQNILASLSHIITSTQTEYELQKSTIDTSIQEAIEADLTNVSGKSTSLNSTIDEIVAAMANISESNDPAQIINAANEQVEKINDEMKRCFKVLKKIVDTRPTPIEEETEPNE